MHAAAAVVKARATRVWLLVKAYVGRRAIVALTKPCARQYGDDPRHAQGGEPANKQI
jgi:hypothetical protein